VPAVGRQKSPPGEFVEPLDFIALLIALVPKAWLNHTRFPRISSSLF
jgi:hypothetical protein